MLKKRRKKSLQILYRQQIFRYLSYLLHFTAPLPTGQQLKPVWRLNVIVEGQVEWVNLEVTAKQQLLIDWRHLLPRDVTRKSFPGRGSPRLRSSRQTGMLCNEQLVRVVGFYWIFPDVCGWYLCTKKKYD